MGCLLRLHIVFLTLVSDLPLDALEGVIQLPSAAIGVMVHTANSTIGLQACCSKSELGIVTDFESSNVTLNVFVKS